MDDFQAATGAPQFTGRVVHGADRLLGESPAFAELTQQIRSLARTEASVLVKGPQGSGKKSAAGEIHRQSMRAQEPLHVVDCAACAAEDLNAVIFAEKSGLCQTASGSTLVLEEIGRLPLALQGKLLAQLSRPAEQHARIIATTGTSLDEMVARDEFREDLFIRLSIVAVDVPSLKNRSGDIVLLAEHFRTYFARKTGRQIVAISPAALSQLESYSWPGNIAELRGVMERAVISAEGAVLEPSDLFLQTGTVAPELRGPFMTLGEIEKQHIFATLQRLQWNRTHAADKLGISIRTLRNKLREYRGADNDEPIADAA